MQGEAAAMHSIAAAAALIWPARNIRLCFRSAETLRSAAIREIGAPSLQTWPAALQAWFVAIFAIFAIPLSLL
jgi:hypothetical protein